MKIAQIRKARGMTQTELASLCDTSQQQIAKIEGAVVDPRLSTLRRIAEALDCELHDLFFTPNEFLSQVQTVMEENDLVSKRAQSQ